jgi:hypothetical protein
MPTIHKTSVWDIIALSGLAIWFSWMVVSLCLGGDAFLGREEGGKYFLGSHGNCTEVSRRVFIFSRIHGYIAWAGFSVFGLTAITKWTFTDSKKDETPVT